MSYDTSDSNSGEEGTLRYTSSVVPSQTPASPQTLEIPVPFEPWSKFCSLVD